MGMHVTDNVGYLLQHLAFTIARQNDELLQEQLGIGFSQFKILMVLQSNPHIQQKQIANSLGQTEASISRQIKLMTDKGLLQTSVNPQNRRVHITTPTDRGMRLVQEAMSALNSYHVPMFDRLDDKQRTNLMESLRSMHEYACQHGKTGACHQPFTS